VKIFFYSLKFNSFESIVKSILSAVLIF